MKNLYKTYTPDNEAVFFNTLAEISNFFDLTGEQVKKCFYPGVHNLDNGITIITYSN